jgi:CO/xanthine dehydrogenase FAD-binding subunit
VLAVADGRVGAGSQERLDYVGVTLQRRQVQRRDVRVPVGPARVRVRTVVEHPANRANVPALRQQVKRAASGEQVRVVPHEPFGGGLVA